MNVKKIVLSILVVGFVFSSTYAVGVNLDFKAGLNLAKQRGKDIDEAEDEGLKCGMLPGVNGGVGIGIKVVDYFCIQPEFLFSMKGAKLTGDIEDQGTKIATVDAKQKINYLEVPLLFKVTIPAGKVVPNVYVGPALGLRLSAKQHAKVDFTPEWQSQGLDDVDTTVDIKDETKAVDFGLAMGGGIDFKAGPGRLIFDIRYTLGFLTAWKPSEGINGNEEEVDAKNGVLAFSLGYGIDFGGN